MAQAQQFEMCGGVHLLLLLLLVVLLLVLLLLLRVVALLLTATPMKENGLGLAATPLRSSSSKQDNQDYLTLEADAGLYWRALH